MKAAFQKASVGETLLEIQCDSSVLLLHILGVFLECHLTRYWKMGGIQARRSSSELATSGVFTSVAFFCRDGRVILLDQR